MLNASEDHLARGLPTPPQSLLLIVFEPYLLQACISCQGDDCKWDCAATEPPPGDSSGGGGGDGRRRLQLLGVLDDSGSSSSSRGGRQLLASKAGNELSCMQVGGDTRAGAGAGAGGGGGYFSCCLSCLRNWLLLDFTPTYQVHFPRCARMQAEETCGIGSEPFWSQLALVQVGTQGGAPAP